MSDPGVDFPEIADRLLSERFAVKIAVGTELRGDGDVVETAFDLRFPDLVPPAFVSGEVTSVFRSAWIRNLRSLIVSDPRLEMKSVPGAEIENLRLFVEDEPFCDNAEVTEVAGQLEVRDFPEDVTSRPGAVEVAATVRLGGDGDFVLGFQFRDSTVEREGFSGAPGITSTHRVDKERPGRERVLDAFAQ